MPRTLILVPGPNGLPKLLLASPGGARAEVFLHGGQVTSWIPADGRERLFLSESADFAPGRAIRGGVPVIFPQLAGEGPLPKHGFARTLPWQAQEAEEGQARLRFTDSETTRAIWPHAFEAELTVDLSDESLMISLAVSNPGSETIQFTSALHTYLRVDDITQVSVSGLQGHHLRDFTQGDVEWDEVESEVRFGGEIERIYYDAPQQVQVREGARSTRIDSTGFPDVILWNPGPVEGDKLRDLEPEGYRRMVCVEPAVLSRHIILAPGSRWEGTQTLWA